MSTPGESPPAASCNKPQRVLSCVLCQQRKIRCDRKTPCANCLRAGADCVLATRQRRRRFAERHLLERLRHYESLLRDNNIPFQPLHPSPDDPTSPGEREPSSCRSELERPSDAKPKAINLWHAMNQRAADARDSDPDHEAIQGGLSQDVNQGVITTVWNRMYQREPNDYLLLGPAATDMDLAAAHPDQAQIFRLWQTYLDNVDPLLKVTHTPTLQSRIIDAAADLAQVAPALEALMFSIYCMALLSCTDEDCRKVLGATRKEKLGSYQLACQQALRRCDVFRAPDRDSLTALFLYLVSIRQDTDPRSLSSLLAVAIRLARRMCLHQEAANARNPALEGEMRRRLWWSLILFDSRICETFDYRTAPLEPTWDCRPPANIHDFDLRPEMKAMPAAHDRPTEAIFAVARSEIADFIRHSPFHLDLTNPLLHRMVDRSQHPNDLVEFEKTMERKYLACCSLDSPLQYMILWTARGTLAKNYLLEYYTQQAKAREEPTESALDQALTHALTVLDSDTRLMASPLTVGYRWFLLMYFPLPAYIHILQDLRRRPAKQTDVLWEAMSDNYEARQVGSGANESPIFVVIARLVLQTWETREAASPDGTLQPPRMVVDIRRKILEMQVSFPGGSPLDTLNSGAIAAGGTQGFPPQLNANMSPEAHGVAGEPEILGSTRAEAIDYASLLGFNQMGIDPNQVYLSPMDWIFAQP
ncbi:C6 zinc finger domain protein [Aspergillus indologenus CBS 114.80]|uniref:C6 zinc finger domain protein n=1 Tax=Aspergillus indologenus CBS 114.80 TaxID=1450541 RepID=A0A2V5I4T1_9EURO|nr:C6 zinc finger domain protein [Aspergillus indologenus CBS 114.80]